MDVIMAWAWMHWPMDGLVSMDEIMRGARMHWPIDGLGAGPYHGLGMDALAKGWTGSMDVIMV